MFRVRSSFKGEIEIKAPLRSVKSFFATLTNFTDMLGGVESIRREAGGVERWTISTDTPVGHVRFTFPVHETSPHANTIEWSPAPGETQNLLRYSIKLNEQNGATSVDVSHRVELRRKRAWDLHPGVGLMGEARLSNALQRRINAAIEEFLDRVKERLEAGSADVTSALSAKRE